MKAYGAASRQMKGQIHGALLPVQGGRRLRVRDGLPDRAKEGRALLDTPGRLGNPWLLDDEKKGSGPRPIAVQWGGHVFVDGGTKTELPFALATSLTSVCNLLDVEIVRDWNIGLPEYWGAVGHYTIANKAISAIRNSGSRS